MRTASPVARVQVCEPLVALLRCVKYSAIHAEGANLDRTNFQYLLRGLLVHLDDGSPEIQQMTLGVLEEALGVDPPVLAAEVRAVRERHRSTKLCDGLIQRAQAANSVEVAGAACRRRPPPHASRRRRLSRGRSVFCVRIVACSSSQAAGELV